MVVIENGKVSEEGRYDVLVSMPSFTLPERRPDAVTVKARRKSVQDAHGRATAGRAVFASSK